MIKFNARNIAFLVKLAVNLLGFSVVEVYKCHVTEKVVLGRSVSGMGRGDSHGLVRVSSWKDVINEVSYRQVDKATGGLNSRQADAMIVEFRDKLNALLTRASEGPVETDSVELAAEHQLILDEERESYAHS